MTHQIFNLPPQQPLSAAGRVLPGSKASFFLTTTDTPTPVYTTSALNVTHTQPVEADAGGRFPAIYLDPTITYKVTVTNSADVLLYTVDPVNDQLLSQSSIGLNLYPRNSAELSAGVTPTNYGYPPLNFLRYGADPTNNDDCSGAFSSLISVLQQSIGGQAVIPLGKYKFSSQPTISGSFVGNTGIYAYGAEFYTEDSENISGLKIEYTATPHIFTIFGLKINHRGNNGPSAGFELIGTTNVRLKDCTVEAHGVEATYAAFFLHNGDPANTDTGNFWTVLEDCTVRKRSGSDVGNIPIGVALIGAQNATTIRGGNIGGTVDVGVYIAPESGQTYISNGVLIDGLALEGGTTGIEVNGASGVGISGLRIVNCRAEAYTTFIRLAGTTAGNEGAVLPHFAGNYLVPGVAYLSNTQGLEYYSLDSSHNPTVNPHLDIYGSFEVRNTSGSGECIVGTAATTTDGMVSMRNSAGTLVGKFRQGTNTTDLRLQASDVRRLEIIHIKGLSSSGTTALNLNGSVTFSSAATATVTFGAAEVDGNYLVLLSGSANETFWWSGRGTSGFTINSSNATSTATVHWWISRA